MSVQSSRAAIAKAAQDLSHLWISTKGSWDDVVAERFEKEYIEVILQDFKPAGTAMDHIGQLMMQIRRECSE